MNHKNRTMLEKRKKVAKVAVFAVFITIQFGQLARGDDQNKNYNQNQQSHSGELQQYYLPVRATKYHKSEPHCDIDTLHERSCTGVKLQEGAPGVVGTVAVDPKIIPIGSLILVTTNNGDTHPYLCADKGGDVTDKTASRILAKQEKRGKAWAIRPVIDIYSPEAITSDWTTVLVIKGPSLNGLKYSERLKRLKERMSIDYWMSMGLETPAQQRRQLLACNER